MANPNNRFAGAKDVYDLEDMFEGMTENLEADDGSWSAEALALYVEIVADYNARDVEFLLGSSDHMC